MKNYFGADIKQCCEKMEYLLNSDDFPIDMNPITRRYYIPFMWPNKNIYTIYHCPWCGTKLTELTDKYYEILKIEYGISDPENASNIPEEFKSEEWWLKRGL